LSFYRGDFKNCLGVIVAKNCFMKVTSVQCQISCDVESQPRMPRESRHNQASAAAGSKVQTTTLVARAVVIVSGAAMIYGIIAYGQIFQSYLQW
jgi:hypothetical protein